MKERVNRSFPWLLYFSSFPMLFYLYNKLDAPSHPYEAQSASDIAQQAQTGDIFGRVLIIALGLIGASLLFRYRERLHRERVISTILFLFLTWNFTTALWSVDPSLSIRRLVSLGLMVTFCAGCAVRMNTFSLSVFIASIPAIGIIPGVQAEVRYGLFHPFSNGYRFGGTAPHPNVQAANLSVATILLFWLCFLTRGRTRVCFMLITAVVSAFLVLCGSRTSLIAVLASLAVSLILSLVRDHKRLIPLAIASAALILGLSGLADLALSSASSHAGFGNLIKHQDESNATSLNGRTDLWHSLLTYVAERPWRGYGFGAFWSPQRIEDISADQGWAIEQSHSAYIEELLGIGIPGALLYVSLLLASLVWCALQFLRHRNGYGSFAAVLLFITIHDVTEGIDIGSTFSNTAFYMIVSLLALKQLEASVPTLGLSLKRHPENNPIGQAAL